MDFVLQVLVAPDFATRCEVSQHCHQLFGLWLRMHGRDVVVDAETAAMRIRIGGADIEGVDQQV